MEHVQLLGALVAPQLERQPVKLGQVKLAASSNDCERVFYKKFGFVEVVENANECIMGLPL
jgi:hypothetical protein